MSFKISSILPAHQYIDPQATSLQRNKKTGEAVFTVVTTGATYEKCKAQAFTIKVTVDGTGVITGYQIVTNGSKPGSYANKMAPEILDGTLFVGKDIDGILAILESGVEYPVTDPDKIVSTGATQSNHLCLCAAAFAAENYKLVGGQA